MTGGDYMKHSQATMQQQGGKGNLKPAPQKMTTGFKDERKKLPDHKK